MIIPYFTGQILTPKNWQSLESRGKIKRCLFLDVSRCLESEFEVSFHQKNLDRWLAKLLCLVVRSYT